MTKKEYLLRVVETLWDKWEIGYAVTKLIENNIVDDTIIDAIYDLVSYSIMSVESEKKSEKLKKSLDVLQKIKLLENRENALQNSELDTLISQI